MPSHFYFSDNFCILAQKLNENIKSEQHNPLDLFHKPKLIVPNRNIKRWLEIFIANPKNNAGGILANWDFQFLESFFKEYYEDKFFPKKLVDKEKTIVDIYNLFTSSKNKEYDFLKFYYSNSTTSLLSQENLKMELICKLVELFENYERHRHQMILSWRRDDNKDQMYLEIAKKKNQIDLYISQKNLYIELFKLQKKKYFSLLEIFDHTSKEKLINKIKDQYKNIHLFGLSQISKLHLEILNQLGENLSLHYYNNFPGSHESNANDNKSKWVKIESIPRIHIGSFLDNHLHPSFEMFELIKKSNDNEKFYAKFAQPKSQSLLQYLQSWIKGNKDINKPTFDDSIQVIAEKNKRAEIEAIYNNILNNLDQDANLKLNEIAILVPSMQNYRVALESVFEAGIVSKNKRYQLPYNLTDFSSGNISYYYSATIVLLRVFMEGRFNRQDLIGLIQNPCFSHAHDLLHIQNQLVHWINKLNIFDSDESGNPAQTWQTGIDRLTLGQVMSNRFEKNYKSFNNLIPHEMNSAEQKKNLTSFIEFIQKLYTSITLIQKDAKNTNSLIKQIKKQIDIHIQLPPDLTNESSIKNQIFTLLQNYQNINEAGFTMESIYLLIKKMGATITANSGQYLIAGITISALQPMRPIPFKIIYIPGLDSESFPGKNDATLLNLKNLKKEKGDISLIERNILLLYESILSASNKIVFSYLSVDLQKDSQKMLSPSVSEILEFIKGHIKTTSLKTKIKKAEDDLFKYKMDIDYFDKHSKRSLPNLPCNVFDILESQLDKDIKKTITNKVFSEFLKDPLSANLKEKYQLRFPYIDMPSSEQTKPLFTPYIINDVLKNCFDKFLSAWPDSLDSNNQVILEEVYKRHIQLGSAPGNLFQNADKDYIKIWFFSFQEVFKEHLDAQKKVYLNEDFINNSKDSQINLQSGEKKIKVSLSLKIPLFQYENNHLILFQLKTNNSKIDYVNLFVQALFFFYLKPERFTFKDKTNYKIDCINIYRKDNTIESGVIKYEIDENELKNYIKYQLKQFLFEKPDDLNLELLLSVDKTLSFTRFKTSEELNKELFITNTNSQKDIKPGHLWKELLQSDFPPDSKLIIENRWDLFLRPFDGK